MQELDQQAPPEKVADWLGKLEALPGKLVVQDDAESSKRQPRILRLSQSRPLAPHQGCQSPPGR